MVLLSHWLKFCSFIIFGCFTGLRQEALLLVFIKELAILLRSDCFEAQYKTLLQWLLITNDCLSWKTWWMDSDWWNEQMDWQIELNVYLYTICIWSWIIQLDLTVCGHIKETFLAIFGTLSSFFKVFFLSLNMTKILQLEASIDPESSDDSES